MRTNGSRDPFGTGLFYFLLTLVVAITLFQKAFPSQDGPLHLYYSDVLANLLRGTGAYAHFFRIKDLFPPYAFQPYLLVGLDGIFQPLMAEKVLVAIYIVWFALGFRYLVHSVDPRNNLVPLFAVPLATNKLLFMGFYNFCYGVATALILIGFWLRYSERLTWRRSLVFVFLVVLLATMHPVPLLIALGFLGIHVTARIVLRLLSAPGAWTGRAVTALRESLRPLIFSLCGAGALLWISAYTSTRKLELFEPDLRRIKQLIKLGTISPFHTIGYRLVLMALVASLLAAAALWLYQVRRRLTAREISLTVMATGCAVTFVLVPWMENNGAHFPDRFPIFALLFVCGIAAAFRMSSGLERRAALAVAGATVLLLGWQALYKHRILEELRGVYEAPVPARTVHGAVIAPLGMGEREATPYNFLPDYWAGAHYLRRAHAAFLNEAWLDASIMMLKPRNESICSYSDAWPMLNCLWGHVGAGWRPEDPAPDFLVATNGGGSDRPAAHLASLLGMVKVPFQSSVLELYARPDILPPAPVPNATAAVRSP